MSASKFSSPFMAKNPMSPLKGNAFIKAKMDAEQSGKESFVVDGKTYPVKGSPAQNIDPKLAKKMADKVQQVGRYRDYVEKKEKGYMDEEDGFIKGDPSKTVSFDRFHISEEIAKGGKTGSKAVKHYYDNKDKYSGYMDEEKRQAVKKGLNIK